MVGKSALLILFGISVIATGCNPERITRLENDNRELKAEVNKGHTAVDYDLQAKCSRDAKGWFHETWDTPDQKTQTILLNYTNHYNKTSNKCFALVEYHFSFPASRSDWANSLTLWDVYENSQYGEFREQHGWNHVSAKAEDKVFECVVLGKKCNTLQEFDQVVRPYMTK